MKIIENGQKHIDNLHSVMNNLKELAGKTDNTEVRQMLREQRNYLNDLALAISTELEGAEGRENDDEGIALRGDAKVAYKALATALDCDEDEPTEVLEQAQAFIINLSNILLDDEGDN